MEKEFYSNGKLLLSGEYAILDGALGLAVPTKFGQSLQVEDTDTGLLEWESKDENHQLWFQASFDLNDLTPIASSDMGTAHILKELLSEAKKQNPAFLASANGLKVTTSLGFPREWGLGTSSTLINNIAQWAEVDAYQLLWNAFGGSGYDIACAQHNGPILYQVKNGKVTVEEVGFHPSFKDDLLFVYLKQKQSSKEAIAAYRGKMFDKEALISNITRITGSMATAQNLSEFEALVGKHEIVLSKILGIPPIKSKLFPDYPGSIKSLGAWGGDFVLATGGAGAKDYFRFKGYSTLLSYKDMVL
ncbi:GYDIA family GHMP kinase [Flagellimonas allohymeniacidonis]|uniref:GHMP kinase n=1 Tax=Flagellimonas allohymeniacidonis TaxID=2517819 RepID=A0A4V2HSJ8_9FLAO|nr:GYDIA family GHMP kinase [Allomuricauda hymeniacidonis]TAI48040.1 GHMP kinase [Allomuricauda hymeniacidonis]